MQIWDIEIRPDNLGLLRRCCRNLKIFNPDSEVWLLRVDLMIARRRYGRDIQAVCAYLQAGREHWGRLWDC